MAFNDDEKRKIAEAFRAYIQSQGLKVSPVTKTLLDAISLDIKNKMHAKIRADSTMVEIHEWLMCGVAMYNAGQIDQTRLGEGFKTCAAIVGEHKTLTVLSTIIDINTSLRGFLYTCITGTAQSNNKYDDSNKKYSPIPQCSDIFPVTDDTVTRGDITMQGIDYIQGSNPKRHFRHMVGMYQKLCAMRRTHPDDIFNPYKKFGFDMDLFAKYLNCNYTLREINEAHDLARADLPKKGRPAGALNKSRFSKPAQVIPDDKDPFAVIPPDNSHEISSIRDAIEKARRDAQDVTTFDVTPSSKALVPSNGNYVTRPEFEAVNNAISEKLGDIVETIDHNHSAAMEAITSAADNILTVASHVAKVEDRVVALEKAQPLNVTIVQKSLPAITTNVGKQHRNFQDLLIMCGATLRDNSRMNMWIYGPPGTGKSHASKAIAEAFQYRDPNGDLGFRVNGKCLYVHDVMGHMHGSTYIRSPFRDAYEYGLAYCADELDDWNQDPFTAMNGALANGYACFADGKLVKRHPNFLFLGCANTVGLGATMEHNTRKKHDAAALDRCLYLDWPIDEDLEDHICQDKAWLRIVRHIRHQVTAQGVKNIIVSPRASMYGESLLAAGLSLDRTLKATLQKQMPDAIWANVSRGMPAYVR